MAQAQRVEAGSDEQPVGFVMRECEGRETVPLVILLWEVAPGGSARTLPSAAPRSSAGNMKICFAICFPSAPSADATSI
jgi:hypothetical protein